MGNLVNSQQTNDVRYGSINKFMYEDSLVIQKVIEYKTAPDQLAICIHKCQVSQQLQHKHLIKLHKYEVNQLTLSIYFEHYDYDLLQDVQKRKLTNNYYQEHELLTILDQLLQVLNFLQQKQIYHEDIRPQNIFLTPNGTPKINQFWILGNDDQNKYFAPEKLQNLEINPYKASAFSLGITMLQLMTLTPMDLIYLKNQVNQTLVQEILQCTPYSIKLVNRIQQYLILPQNSRQDFLTQSQVNLQQKLLQSPPKTITSSQRFTYKTSQSPINRPLNHSPFTFRRLSQVPVRIVKQAVVQPIRSPVQIVQSPQIVLTPRSPNIVTPKKVSPKHNDTPKTDLDSRIYKALKQTNETLKKNQMLQ